MASREELDRCQNDLFNSSRRKVRDEIAALGVSQELADRIIDLPSIRGPLWGNAVKNSMFAARGSLTDRASMG